MKRETVFEILDQVERLGAGGIVPPATGATEWLVAERREDQARALGIVPRRGKALGEADLLAILIVVALDVEDLDGLGGRGVSGGRDRVVEAGAGSVCVGGCFIKCVGQSYHW